ncbi:2,5-didehydrogluconate reductase DkgA [Yersinia pseudotuberculosis]|uniref:2,5-didehydrogluconate reductase DkgA n=1 Tax=Yersinia pseudotuberculosis TaxID=633 RepID=UPI0003D65DAB|nr:2,5-didehydrogluconate reductase DkgA [Yersinia pseudotuberculosis]AJJ71212.1 2,5-diketo-D-gluconic acid reductase A [Yersinia pseudotuberculosis]PSH15291.1 2,5-didehydrogluconate reductase A [Yersinia pseudotuberculosis]PSH37139.1 2,5-didehydrogluconate reductase A [Yersinia pseudotuberculosis]PSH47431.1 2,5-didehydrogluconate reductase A [Yersinia pseudotuberculosis]CNK92211.1 2%2C5-diketo-D-gluconate reductase A [Yersinia pseudotuberculosis]
MTMQPLIKLHDGRLMPQLGLGVWQASIQETELAVSKALEVGYRSIDTAAIYKNEEGVGKALKAAAVARDELFITTKLWNDDQHNPQQALETSLQKLQLDYIDLYLIHWPDPKQDHYVSAWRELVTLKEQGLIRSIGVCNFHIPHLQRLIDETGIAPTVNQIELHPLLQQRQLHAWNATHHIATESWSPLAQGGKGVFDQEIIRKLAQQYNKTPAQIVIRWHLDSGLIVIPKSVTPARIRENFEVFDFKLQKEGLLAIAKLDCGKRLGPDPEVFGSDR